MVLRVHRCEGRRAEEVDIDEVDGFCGANEEGDDGYGTMTTECNAF